MKGSSSQWRDCIAKFILGGRCRNSCNWWHLPLLPNPQRQGDHLSTISFNVVGDTLAFLMARAKEDAQVKYNLPHLVEGEGKWSRSYNMDDVVLWIEHDIAKEVNMKVILSFFEQLSGFQRVKLIFLGKAMEVWDDYCRIFCVRWDPFHLTILQSHFIIVDYFIVYYDILLY